MRFKPGADQSVKQLELVLSSAGAPQVLQIKEAWSPSGEFLLRAVDLNFDGVLDLAFGPVMGTPNLVLDYWTVNAQQGRLEPIGRYSNLAVDPQTRELKTHEKGGHAGALYEDKSYRWIEGKLVVTRAVSQAEEASGKGYVETAQRFEAGQLVDEKTRHVAAP